MARIERRGALLDARARQHPAGARCTQAGTERTGAEAVPGPVMPQHEEGSLSAWTAKDWRALMPTGREPARGEPRQRARAGDERPPP